MVPSVTIFPTPSPNALAELALVGAMSGRLVQPFQPPMLGSALRQFWASSRRMQSGWQKQLAGLPEDLSLDFDKFERVALEVFLAELLTRVWATNWTIGDRAQGLTDVERILTNTLLGLEHVRKEVLLLMVRQWQGPTTEMISRIDRFRRRSERWADLLIAGPASVHGVWEFAVEPQRAQDFGAETWTSTTSVGTAASLLVSAGLRVMFGSPWPQGCCQDALFGEMLSAVYSTLPAEAFREDGTLLPTWEWR